MPFNRLQHSILGEIRPRFSLKINCDPEKAMFHIINSLPKDPTVNGVRSTKSVFIKLPKEKQHYWSPEITVRIEKQDHLNYTNVHCLIGPRQAVWAMFSLIYAAIIIVISFAGMFGMVQYQMDGYSPWLWVIPIGLLTFSTVFITSKMGQKKGRDEMLHLVSFVYHKLSEITTVERIES